MAQLVYIDETGSVGKGARAQPLLTLVAVMVDEDKVQPLASRLGEVAMKHLGWLPADFEFHGNEVWSGGGHWKGKTPPELLAAYEEAVTIMDELDIDVAFASINKAKLHEKYAGGLDHRAYRLALQFLVEKLDTFGPKLKILVADEAKEQQLKAVKMVSDLQEYGSGEVIGKKVRTIIDSLHYVDSKASPGVQLADLAAFAMQRRDSGRDKHVDAAAGIQRIAGVVYGRAVTWREPWPRR